MKFELNTLDSYDDDALILELQRVAKLCGSQKLTMAAFDANSKVHSSTVRNRFGGWTVALEKAGLGTQISGHAMRLSKSQTLTRDAIVQSLKKVATDSGKDSLTLAEFSEISGISQKTIRSIGGAWRELLTEAGLRQSGSATRYTDAECFENILALWTHFGRQPTYAELSQPPSKVGAKAYTRRWGGWRKALSAFVEYAQQGSSLDSVAEVGVEATQPSDDLAPKRTRHIGLRVRYKVLKRDGFRCVICGASPAKEPGVELHLDHIEPWSKGGSNESSNLRTLCSVCNLGKGDLHESA